MITILVAEDDAELRELFRAALAAEGFRVRTAADGLEAFEAVERGDVDLAVCDVMMPRMDGFELVRVLRRSGNDLPILVITAKGERADKREGFRAGVDDYMVKPVDVDEMLWRIEALLRRSHVQSDRKLVVGQTVLDGSSLSVSGPQGSCTLPNKEFALLFKLLSAPGRVFTRRQLLEDVWGMDAAESSHTLDVHISRLRERFRDCPDFRIDTVRGLGYKGVRTDER